jgi:pentatricopeptide repeat protein
LFWGGAQYQSDNLASSSDSSSPDNIPMTVTSTTHLQDESTSTSGSDSTGSSSSGSGSTIRGTFDTCRLAFAVLDEMERRSQKYGEAKPTSVTYTLVIKTCFRANNLELADQMMKRMESSDTPPNLRTYTDIIIHFGALRTASGAEQAETIFHYLKEMAIEQPSLKRNVIAYSIVLNAWARVKDIDASERLWNIYKILKKDVMELDVPFASRLISYLCVRALDNDNTDLSSPVTFTEPVELGSSSPPLNLQRALIVLEEMEKSENSSKKPDLRIYKSVI